MIKISELPNINNIINGASLLPLVQNSVTSNTTFANVSANILNAGMKVFNYVPKLVSQDGTDPVYNDSFNFQSQYVIFNNKIVLFNGNIYASENASVVGAGIAAITLPDVGVYVSGSVRILPSWNQLFNLNVVNGAGYHYSLGFAAGPSTSIKPEYHNKIVKLRSINNTATGGSPDLPFSAGAGQPSVGSMPAGFGLLYFGMGILN